MVNIIELLAQGLALGSYIAIAAIGFTLIYAIADMINFAYGEYMTLGAFIGLFLSQSGLGVVASLIITIPMTAVLGYALARVFFTPLQESGPIPLLLTSIGLGFILQNTFAIVWGNETRVFRGLQGRYDVLGGSIYFDQLFVIAMAVMTLAAVHLLLHRTDIGLAMRATSDAENLASISGINPFRIRRHVWLIASGLAGLAGLLLGIQSTINPYTGFSVILIVIAAAILGGAGSAYGAMVGAYVVAFTITLASAFLPGDLGSFGRAMAFFVLIVALLFRPSGIANVEVEA
ncbi:branched-chain amino acid ABC transporter permease [Saliphagus sp. GCM10025334]